MGIEVLLAVIFSSLFIGITLALVAGSRGISERLDEGTQPALPAAAIEVSDGFFAPTQMGDRCEHCGWPVHAQTGTDPSRMREIIAGELQRYVSRELSLSAHYLENPERAALYASDLLQ